MCHRKASKVYQTFCNTLYVRAKTNWPQFYKFLANFEIFTPCFGLYIKKFLASTTVTGCRGIVIVYDSSYKYKHPLYYQIDT